MRYRNDPDGARLPVKLDTATNGEFAPIPLSPAHHAARRLAFEQATTNARRLNLARRAFLVSACGAATTLLGMNAAYAAAGRRGGFFDLPQEANLDLQVARSTLDRNEFVFDVQGHFVNPTGAWTKALPPGAQPLRFTELKGCAAATAPELGYLQCLGSDEFIKDIFLDSDTDLIVLSFVPSTRKDEPLTIETKVGDEGRVIGYEILSGPQTPEVNGWIREMMSIPMNTGFQKCGKYDACCWRKNMRFERIKQ